MMTKEAYKKYIRERILDSMCAPIPTYYNPPSKIVLPPIKKIIANPPATIILWEDGSKTVCKTETPEVDHVTLPDGKKLAVVPKDEFDPEVGVAMCIAKRYFGSRNQLLKAAGKASNEYLERLAKGQKRK